MKVRSGGGYWTVVAYANIRLSISDKKATGSLQRSVPGTHRKKIWRRLKDSIADLPNDPANFPG